MLSKKIGLQSILPDLKGKRVLMRVDYNVPVKQGVVKDVTRIQATIPSIEAIFKAGAKSLVLMSHLGRPDGNRNENDSMKPLVPIVEKLSNRKIIFLNDCIGPEVEKACENPPEGTIILLENLRFHPEEEGAGVIEGKKIKPTKEENEKFRDSLTKLGDIFINDAFGTAHRAHSSMVGVKHPIRAAGFLMYKEIESFAKIMENPARPLLVIMGGAKVKDKIQIIMKMLDLVNEMIIGGGMAFTFKKVLEKMEIGGSLFDEEGASIVESIVQKAKEKNVLLHFPVDFLCADNKDKPTKKSVFSDKEGIPSGMIGLDNGPKTIELFNQVIDKAKTILWNGPQGYFENPEFLGGSKEILHKLIEVTKKGVITVAGGGETCTVIKGEKGADELLTHVSTGGGASLELLEGKPLPGIEYLSEKK